MALSQDEMEARMAAMRNGVDPNSEGPVPAPPLKVVDPEYRHYKPLVDAADEYITWAQHPGDRVMLGIPAFDKAMRGIAPGELCTVQGYAHSGKTVLVTQMILQNPDKRIVLFTPDETRVLVLVKLASIVHGISAEDLEALIEQDDPEAKTMVRSTATDHFPNLAVFDNNFGLQQMSQALQEVTEALGAPQLVVYDYLKLLPDYDDVVAKYDAIKQWGKGERIPLIVLQQSSRTKGANGAKVTIDSGEYGGEQQSTFIIGVRRKKHAALAAIDDLTAKLMGTPRNREALEFALEDAHDQLRRHRHSVTFNLVKNKRPPSRLVDDVDFKIDPETGRVTAIEGTMGEPRPVTPIENVPMWDDEEPY